jgi:hypothetical protein
MQLPVTIKKWWWLITMVLISLVILVAILKAQYRVIQLDKKLNKTSYLKKQDEKNINCNFSNNSNK